MFSSPVLSVLLALMTAAGNDDDNDDDDNDDDNDSSSGILGSLVNKVKDNIDRNARVLASNVAGCSSGG